MRNGDDVVYTGEPSMEVAPGERGHILSCTSSYAHVQWHLGHHVGLHPTEELEVVAVLGTIEASLDDSLEVASSSVGVIVSLASAQETYDATGGPGLVSHLASAGHLSVYASVVEDALQLITSALQQDPVLRQLSMQMDPDEADELFRRAATTLLTDSGEF
jgi:hypothetical protein